MVKAERQNMVENRVFRFDFTFTFSIAQSTISAENWRHLRHNMG